MPRRTSLPGVLLRRMADKNAALHAADRSARIDLLPAADVGPAGNPPVPEGQRTAAAARPTGWLRTRRAG